MGDVVAIQPYRVPIGRLIRRGAFEACPACAAPFVVDKAVCHFCGGTKFLTATGKEGQVSCCAVRSCPGHSRANPIEMRRINVEPGRFCGPGQRVVVVGRRWWWIFSRKVRCDEPGAHLHQRCSSCGWLGIVLPASDEA